LKHHEDNTFLTEHIDSGKYILYAKIDPTIKSHYIPRKCSVSVYSKYSAQLTNVNKKKYPRLLQIAFKEYAKHNKTKTFNDNLMWVAWKVLYTEGGFAYVALGNN
jgi:glutaredoxin 2